jgi:twitching motility two-component system response regulator PilH
MGKTVLVVDDDPDVRLITSSILEENGYTPMMAVDGKEGWERIRQEIPDLLILDVLMPRESGIRLYRQIKTDARLQRLPVIIQSGIAEKSFLRSQKALSEFGGQPVPAPDAYLEKPVEPETLLEALQRVLGSIDRGRAGA